MEEFEKIYLKYYDSVFRYVRSLCRNEVMADEITQDTFLKALKYIDTFRGECELQAWLCRIARNHFYTMAKHRSRMTEISSELFLQEKSIEEKLLDRESAFQIHGVLHRLEEPYKEVFWMRTFGELSFKEIGRLFQRTENWARVTYYRAKIKIKEEIK